MNNQKGFVWIPLLLAIIAVMGISGGAYIYTHQQKLGLTDISLTPEQNPQVHFVTSPAYNIHPAKADWLIISADAPDMSVDLTGWAIRSTQSGKSFTIKPQGSAQNIAIASSDTALFIHTVGAPSKSYRLENEIHLYFGEDIVAWGKDHDIIELVNPAGVVVDTYSYPAQTSSIFKFTAAPTSGTAPLTVTFTQVEVENSRTSINYGDGTNSSACELNDTERSNCSDTFVHTYTKPGIYTVNLWSLTGTDGASRPPLGTATITVTEPKASQNTSVPGMSTYVDKQHGFSFQYPPTLSVETSGYGSIKSLTVPPAAFINLWDNNQTEGYITFSVSTDMQDVSNCMETVVEVPLVSINGTIFKKLDFGTGDVNGYGREYKMRRNNVCYDIELLSFAGACVSSGCENRRWSAQTETALLSRLDKIAQTFTLTSADAISVEGMSKYTDNDFGFSFWYPSIWKVSSTAQTITIADLGHVQLTIEKLDKPSGSITVGNEYYGYNMYFFNKDTHTWMVTTTQAPTGAPDKTEAMDVSRNTMGGLHMFGGGARFGLSTLVPLSAHHFLMVTTSDMEGTFPQDLLSKTIVATDPSVGTPVSVEEQKTTITAEQKAYAGR